MPIDTTYYTTYDGKKTAELVFKPAVEKPALSQFFKIVEGIKGKQAVYFIDPAEFVTILDPGCGLGASQLTLNITGETWELVDLKIWKWECWTSLRGKVWEWMLKAGNQKAELDGTDYADYMLEAVQSAAYHDLVRMAWFADSTMLVGALANSGELPFYKTFDGIWKRIFAAVTANKSAYVSLSEVNNNTTNPGQELPDGYASGLFRKMWKKQQRELKALPMNQRQFLVTDSLYQNYLEEREAALGVGIEAAYVLIADGIKTLTYRGVPLQVVDEWDIRIASSFTIAGVADLPHRAILTQFGNLQLSFDALPTSSATSNPLRVWNNIDTEKWNARSTYSAGAQIANKGLLVAAY